MTQNEIDKLTSEQMRIRIAEKVNLGRAVVGFLPDYLNDLNAMHKAEKILNIEQQDRYLIKLYQVSQDPHICSLTHHIAYVCADALTRAKAFLLVVD